MSRQIRATKARPLGDAIDAATPRAKAPLPPGAASDNETDPAASQGGLDDLYRRHAPWLHDLLRRRFGRDTAEDLAQETFARAGAYLGAGVGQPRALLMTIARNVVRDQFRRGQVRARHLAEAAAQGSGLSVAPPAAVDDDLHVREAVKGLPPQLRDVLLLSKIGGLTNREIAQRYRVSVRTIDKRMQKAIALFVTRLRD